MRSIIILIIFLCTMPCDIHSQVAGFSHGLDVSIGQMHSGKNLRLGYSIQKQKIEFTFGTKFHLNNPDVFDSRDFAYQYRFHAYKWTEHFGLYAQFQRRLIQSKQNWSLCFRADGEIGRLGLTGAQFEKAYIPVNGIITPDSEVIHDTIFPSFPLFRKYDGTERNITHVQVSIALVLKTNLTKHLSLNLAAGLGTSFVKTPFQSNLDPVNNIQFVSLESLAWEPFNPYLRLGFAYTFKKKEKKES